VYDSTNTWGYLGAVYGTDGGDLAAHFGQVTAEPVVDYIAGQVNNYTATIYIGSTYDEPIPIAFLNDVLTTTHPVIWAGYNAWQLSGNRGSAEDAAFISKYGWDPSTSYIDTTDDPVSVSYGTQNFTRDPANGANIVPPHHECGQCHCAGPGKLHELNRRRRQVRRDRPVHRNQLPLGDQVSQVGQPDAHRRGAVLLHLGNRSLPGVCRPRIRGVGLAAPSRARGHDHFCACQVSGRSADAVAQPKQSGRRTSVASRR
jgi:hypothetical protein